MKKTALYPMPANWEDRTFAAFPWRITLHRFNRAFLPAAAAFFCVACTAFIFQSGAMALLEIAVVVAYVAWSGYLYQTMATIIDQRRYPPPGKLVEIDGRRMHIHSVGAGSLTVILEAGLGAISSGWGWIQPEIGKFTRVVSYDRTGLGWSDTDTASPTGQRIAWRLHKLLQTSGIMGPYVLVGHSMGGLLVRIFANQYPDEVVGMVLVDASHPDQHERYPEIQRHMQSGFQLMNKIPLLTRFGWVRLTELFRSQAEGLPAKQRSESGAFLSSHRHLAATLKETLAWKTLCSEVRYARGLGNKPLAVVSAGKDVLPGGAELQAELAALATTGTHRVVEGATHLTLLTHRDHAMSVVETIRQVVEQVREASAADGGN
ncbi:MAG TPA: alpha/beta hydrolase [Methylococcaceae bacterium]|nr:alpha/beta hydrolase [Methylococcaceae bacterium]